MVNRVANNFKTPGPMWAPNLSSFTGQHWYFGVHIFNEMLKAVTKKKKLFTGYSLNKFQHFFNARDFVWGWSNENSDSRKCFICRKIVKSKVKVESWVKPQLGSEKVWQNFYSPCGRSNPKDLLPTDKITRICEWASGFCNPGKYQRLSTIQYNTIH